MTPFHASTILRDHDSARRDGVPARAAHCWPGATRMQSPAARWAVTVPGGRRGRPDGVVLRDPAFICGLTATGAIP